MTALDIILEHKAWVAFFALSCGAALVIVFYADRLKDDWFGDGFEFKVTPATALIGCLSIVVLGLMLGVSA